MCRPQSVSLKESACRFTHFESLKQNHHVHMHTRMLLASARCLGMFQSNWLKPRLPCTPLGSSDDLPTCSHKPSTFSPRTRAPPRRRLHPDRCLDHRSLHRSLRVGRRFLLPVAALRSPPRRRAVAPSQTICCASLRWPCRRRRPVHRTSTSSPSPMPRRCPSALHTSTSTALAPRDLAQSGSTCSPRAPTSYGGRLDRPRSRLVATKPRRRCATTPAGCAKAVPCVPAPSPAIPSRRHAAGGARPS